MSGTVKDFGLFVSLLLLVGIHPLIPDPLSAKSLELLHSSTQQKAPINTLEFSKSGQSIVTVDVTGSLSVWKTENGEKINRINFLNSMSNFTRLVQKQRRNIKE